MLALLLALLTAGAVAGALLGIRMIRADAELAERPRARPGGRRNPRLHGRVRRRPPRHALRAHGIRSDGPPPRRGQTPPHRHGGQSRRPDPQPLRRPPGGVRRLRRRPRPRLPLQRPAPVRRAHPGLRARRRRRPHLASANARRSSTAPLPDFLRRPRGRGLGGPRLPSGAGPGRGEVRGPLGDELRITLRQMDMGVSRRQAFDGLRKRNSSEQVAHKFVLGPASRARSWVPPSPRPSSNSPRTCAARTPRTPAAAPPRPSPRRRW